MQASAASKLCIGTLVAVTGVVLFGLSGTSCGPAPTPFLVNGPGQLGNEPPTLSITEPIENITRSQGAPLLIRWTDSDSDDNAHIAFELVSTTSNARVPLVSGLEENDLTAPDTVTVGTSLIPQGTYNLLGTIDDGTNPPVETFATVGGADNAARITVRITGEGEVQQSIPPTLAVLEPAFNQSVTQDDPLRVRVVPSALGVNANRPFDPDSEITLSLILDLDQDPNNDDPTAPLPDQIIVLETRTIARGGFQEEVFEETIDLDVVPAREGGLPYYIRVTAHDLDNPPVHRYAVGTISVVRLAFGLVDLAEAGTIISGARWYGFNPGALTGSTISGITDFDLDGADDFVIVAQKGNPRNLGPIGEAYLVYGQVGQDPTEPGIRFGGALPVNSVSQTISGVIFEAPPERLGSDFKTDGITDVGFIRSINGDDRPDLLFGLAHVPGAFEGMDFDPGDDTIDAQEINPSVEIEIRQGRYTITVDDTITEAGIYSGVQDTYISRAQPSTNFGSLPEIHWQNDTSDHRIGLLKFSGLQDIIDRSEFVEPGSIRASLQFRVFRTGSDATVHRSRKDFSAATTYNSFSGTGNAPVGGTDYEADSLGTISGANSEFTTLQLDDYVTELVDNVLNDENNELRLVIVPPAFDPGNPTDVPDPAAIRSSEYSAPNADRPTLTITYTRLNTTGADGCYPDGYVNNTTNQAANDDGLTGGGMTLMVSSTNRDNNPRTNPVPTRLESTSVALELVGQQPNMVLDGGGVSSTGNILPRADDYDADGRIAGARIMGGWYDFVDHLLLTQPPRAGLFGQSVASIPDINSDGLDEIVISAPRNERYIEDLFNDNGFDSTHWHSTIFFGSIIVIPGADYNDSFWRETGDDQGNSVIPFLDQHVESPYGSCTTSPPGPRHGWLPADVVEVFAEDVDDMLGGARSAGDFNQDGVGDIVCGAYANDPQGVSDAGAAYILYGRTVAGNIDLKNADDPILRSPMLRIRGVTAGDRIGWRQSSGLDVNGDRIDDVFVSSPFADFGGVNRPACAGDFNRDGVVNDADINIADFTFCERNVGDEVFSDDSCKAFDYDYDGDIDEEDRCVFCCLSGQCTPDPDCVHGHTEDCCDGLVNNGFVGVIFGGVFTDGDRDISQMGSTDLAGTRFYGTRSGDLAGWNVASAGDFNQDGFGDLLLSAPGEVRLDTAGRERQGVVYLIFGGTHLYNSTWDLASVGTSDLPGIVFLSPYVRGRPNEAAPLTVAGIGDINNDGFDDIAIGNPKADFIDLSFPQGPEAPGLDAEVGRRRNAGDVYVIYGNNFGSTVGG